MTESRQKLQARLDLYDEMILLTRYNDGAATACHEVAPHDLAAAFAGADVASPLLPSGCIHWSHKDGRDRYLVYLPPSPRTLILLEADQTRTPLIVPLPPLLWLAAGNRHRLYATKARPSQPSERLFVAPFPNVDRDRGGVCFGDVRPPSARADTLPLLIQAFFESDFNQHWINGCSRQHDADVRLIWRQLAAAQAAEYPLDDLVPTHYKLGDLLS